MATHTIQKGETLSQIARHYNTTVEDLEKKNNLKNVNSIMAGTTIEVGENVSNYDNYTQSSKDSDSTEKYLAHAYVGSWIPLAEKSYNSVKDVAKSASQRVQNMDTVEKDKRNSSAVKGAFVGSAILPGIGTLVGSIIGWLKG